ncbi:hypothetical protein MKL09_26710 [Methylobacterium sp. J-048]|uniref:hypothetical protein n=1 Tax=Methylobacterium sp. J-048 TaxID=2836635 RepID=UPI001FB96302|nr:hypothetical protein [Methylobacterium sp. J-048]MCJ2060110.1 hypothetical protein [Methylobacterium sp. J-048]
MTSDAPKRRGRPPIAEEDRKSGNLTFRTRGDLRSQLEASAQQSGRSVSEEIEYRLQVSFDRRSVALQMYGGNNSELMEALYYVLASTRWMPDFNNHAASLAAITTLLAYSGCTYGELTRKNFDPAIWMFLSQLGIARACGLDADAAQKEAERIVPEMASAMLDQRVGEEILRRSKKVKPT